LTVQQCKLAEIVALFIRFEDRLARRAIFYGNSSTRLDEEKLLTRFTLGDDVFAFVERTRLEDVGDFGAFLRLEGCENGNFGQESLV